MRFRTVGLMSVISIVVCAAMLLSGCVYMVIGGVAAAGGYAVTRDTIQGETDKKFDDVWQAATDIVAVMGTVKSESYELGKLEGIVNGARVNLSVSQLTPSTVRLTVKARKFIFPSIANAQNIYVKIMNRVNR